MKSSDPKITLDSPELNLVLAHWCEIRGNRLMPFWDDIRPATIKAALPIVWSYRYDSEMDEFLGGFAGDKIQRLLGGTIKNVQFRQLHDEEPHFFTRAKRVMFEPAVFCGRGLLFRKRERQCYGERIILPFLCGTGSTGGIIGATDFRFSLLYKSEQEIRGELEHWSGLSTPANAPLFQPPENWGRTTRVSVKTP